MMGWASFDWSLTGITKATFGKIYPSLLAIRNCNVGITITVFVVSLPQYWISSVVSYISLQYWWYPPQYWWYSPTVYLTSYTVLNTRHSTAQIFLRVCLRLDTISNVKLSNRVLVSALKTLCCLNILKLSKLLRYYLNFCVRSQESTDHLVYEICVSDSR